MKKQLIAGLTAATALVGTGVQADELVPTTPPAPTTVAAEEKVQPVTAEAVDTAKAELDQASQAVADQEKVVETAEKAQEAAQADVDTAQAQVTAAEELAAKATPEEIKSAEGKVTTAEEAVKTAEATVTTAEEAKETAQVDVDKQKSVVAEATKVVTDKTEAVNQAQADVDKAQAILDGTNSASVVKEADEAKTALDQATENLTKANQELVAAKEADIKRAEAIQQAQGQVTTAQADLTTKTTALTEATEAAKQARTALETVQTAYAKAQGDYQSINTIILSEDYIRYMKASYDYSLTKSERDEADKKLLALGNSLKVANQFKASEADKSVPVDFNNLTAAQRLELTLFAEDLTNQVRTQMGTDRVSVTPSSVELGWYQAEYYQNKLNTAWRLEHDTASVQKQFGLSWVDENLAGTGLRGRTMAAAKGLIYEAYKLWLFAPNESLHASSIAGVRNTTEGASNYMGIGISVYSDGSVIINYNNVVDGGYLSVPENFDTTSIPNSRTAEALTKVHDQAKEALSTAQTTNNQAQEALKQAQSAQDQAKTKLESALIDLDKAKAVAVQTETAQLKRDQADAAKVQAQSRYDKAQRALTSLSADVKTKQDNLAKAKEVLKTKQADQALAQGALDTETGKLKTLETELATKTADMTKAKQALSDRQDDLKKAQDYLASLLNAPAHLTKAKESLKLATDKLDSQRVAVQEAKALLVELQAKEVELSKAYASLFERYQAQLAAERAAKLKAEHDAIKRQGKQPLPVLDASGQIIGYTAAKDAPKPSTSRPAAVPVSSSGAKKTLPATGSQSSALLSLLGSAMATVGVTAFRRKKD